ncbi:MULE transposase domain-containing protein [Phthorimaea operculella]|nr:MULE transposase domain-containing protein [Phthorimaea operculella]
MSHSKLVKTIRGADMLIMDGYSYHLNKKQEDVYYWKCTKKKSAKCGVTVTTKCDHNGHHLLKKNYDHVHFPEPEAEQRFDLISSLKTKATASMDCPSQIIQRCIQEIPSTSAPHLPSKAAMRMIIQRERNKNIPDHPTNVNAVHIPEEYTKFDKEPFLLGHYTFNGESVIVFSTSENLKLLIESAFWIMDGTFECCPDPYTQIYTIHGKVGRDDDSSKILPLVFGLLSHKTENCYQIFIEIIISYINQHLEISAEPQIVITDFELAVINAVKKAFPNCTHKLCFFHFTQIIWRNIEAAGLSKLYSTDTVFAHQMRHLSALAFLQPHEIPPAFKMLKKEVLPRAAKKLLKWFERYYVNGTKKSIIV